ncbi:hypothetical protein Clacol_002941 [Clathrus columnatus]|uniref:Uncharacterized protein n=1 Tax=Clathrus columnatus TaxID=1419009 RepID=A0AAV5A504_9AGAM|nr:hypothetical protein Clacol_002941 [Clathrus columnatus]
MPPAASSSKALNAILPQIATFPYEAHQKARTFASRYVKASQFDVAIDVLFQSARELLKVGQQGSGTDLGCFLIDVYDSKPEPISEEAKSRLTQLIALAGSNAKVGTCPAGDPDLHHYVGELLLKGKVFQVIKLNLVLLLSTGLEGILDQAEPHFLAAGKRDSARLLAKLALEWLGDSPDVGKFASRGVIPYLSEGNILAARTFLSHFLSQLLTVRPDILAEKTPLILGETSDEIYVTTDQVLNFLQLAIRTCQRAQGDKNKTIREAWVRLCGSYQSKGGLMSEPVMRKALAEIGQLYFSIPMPRTQANPLQDMFSSLFGGGTTATKTLSPISGTALD